MKPKPEVKIRSARRSWKYAAAGVLLGLGCPMGLLLMRYFVMYGNEFWDRVALELDLLRLIYLYTGAGCVLVFSVFGWILGKGSDRLEIKTRSLEREADAMERLSITDGLTDLYIHNYILKRLDEELARAKRYRYSLGCLFMDIDNFKELNDRYGHPFGDAVLAKIAKVLSEETRDTDILGRYGGDEFLALLPGSDAQAAYRIAERIRKAVEGIRLEASGEPARATISVGIYASEGSLPAARLTELADRALREAKRMGKNKSILIGAKEGAAQPAGSIHN